MTQNEKQRFAEYLFDEIGLIDDRYIAEAETAYRPKKQKTTLRRFLILAATLSLIVTSALSLLIGNYLQTKNAAADNAPNDAYSSLSDQSMGTVSDLSLRLFHLKEKTKSLQTPSEEIQLFNGQAQVIWKYAEEEDYRVKKLSAYEKALLTQKLNSDSGTERSPEGSSAEQSLDGIWISFGDGTVISPCLEQSKGNIGYGTLFDYNPELEPSKAFTDYLCGILS